MNISFDQGILSRSEQLTESGQRNPIRWICLQHISEDSFKNTTPWFKCKDYFNDAVVWWHQKIKFSVYGMSSDSFVFNEDGSMYVGVKNTTDQFQSNLCLLDKIESGMGCKVTVMGQVSDVTVLHLSKECFQSTFRISMVTWLIRMANVGKTYTTYQDVFNDTVEMEYVSIFSTSLTTKLKELDYSKVNEDGYQWYCGPAYNSKVTAEISPYLATSVHNCGVATWDNYGKI